MTPPVSNTGTSAPRSWRRWLPRRLDHQLMLFTSCCLLLSNLGYGAYTVHQQTTAARRTLDAQMSALAQNLATISTQLLIVNDLAAIENIAMQTAPVPGMLGLMVTDPSGRTLSEVVLRNDQWSPRFRVDTLKVPDRWAAVTRAESKDGMDLPTDAALGERTGTLGAWHPVLAGTHLGWVRVSYQTDHLEQAAARIWQQSLALVALFISGSLAVLWLSFRGLVRELRATAEFAEGLDNALGERLEVGVSTIEIEALGEALNTLSERLYKQRTDLINQKFALDQHAIVSITDLQGTICYANQRFCDISGYSQEELIGQSHRIVNSGHHGPEFFEELWRTISAAKVWAGEVQNRRKDGSHYWVFSTVVPLLGADGLPEQYIALRTDITAHKNAELTLARERQSLNNIIEGTHVGTWEWNIETGSTRLNERWAQMLGYTLAELEPSTITTWSDLIHPDDRSAASALLERHLDGVVPAYENEVRVRHKDGHWVWVLDRGKLLSRSDDDGRPRWMAGTRMDISARKQAQAEVARSAALLRGAIEAIDEAFVLYDPEDRLVVCNDKYRQTYPTVAHLMVPGNTFEQIIRPGAEKGDYIEAVGRVDAWVAERLAIHRAGNSTVVQRLANGRTLRILERKMPDGHIVGFRIDISELVQATEAAQAASTAKSQFLANMSHELRTPMNAILGMLTLLRRTELNARQADYASKTEGAARSLLGLLNDILDFSKVEAGKMTLDEHPFDIDRLLQDLSVIVSANLGSKPVEVVFDIDPALPRRLVGDAMRLQQVLINLCGNAIKFTAKGEVVLSMRVQSQDADSVGLEIAVRDTGIGIAPQNQTQIFSGFTQAEASTTRRFGGTGLGLAISQRMVALMGGELQLESALGQGSRFCFCLNLALDTSTPSSADSGDAPAGQAGLLSAPLSNGNPRLMGLRLLVVEDNLNNQQVARELLEAEGASVQIAHHGQEGVDAVAAASPPFDVVLMDLQMPVMDGLSAARQIRQGLGMQRLPIVAMTANAMASDREACLAAGMNDHVGKPFDLDHLVNVLLKHAGPRALNGAQAQEKVLTATATAPSQVTQGESGRPAAPAAKPSAVAPDSVSEAVRDAAEAAGVDIRAALGRLGGKTALYQRLLGNFVSDLPTLPDQLKAHWVAGDVAAAARLLHTLKGLAATVGAIDLSASAAAAERQVTESVSGHPLPRLLEATCTAIHTATPALARVLQALQTEELSRTPPAPPSAADSQALRSVLCRLAEQLSNADMAATETMANLQQQWGANAMEELAVLNTAVSNLDFDLALQHCEALSERIAADA